MKKVYTISVLGLFLNTLMFAQINDIKSFLDTCPTNDTVIGTILKDFEIRLNGNLVTEYTCTEPVSAMNTVNYSNPLIYLQTLRATFHLFKAKSQTKVNVTPCLSQSQLHYTAKNPRLVVF